MILFAHKNALLLNAHKVKSPLCIRYNLPSKNNNVPLPLLYPSSLCTSSFKSRFTKLTMMFRICVLLLLAVVALAGAATSSSSSNVVSKQHTAKNSNNLLRQKSRDNHNGRNLLATVSTATTSESTHDHTSHNKLDSLMNRPMFLFSGQSNMEGHTIGPLSIGYSDDIGGDMLKDIISILYDGDDSSSGDSDSDDFIDEELKQYFISDRIKESTSVDKTSAATNLAAEKETIQIMHLYKQGLLDKINEPLDGATCSYFVPENSKDSYHPPNSRTISPYAQCGQAFGPELMFSHVLTRYYKEQQNHTESSSNNNMYVAKVAVGGTQIYKDWFPGVGNYWDALNHTIHNSIGQWNGFAWYQGENDCFPEEQNTSMTYQEDTSWTYLGNLTKFVEVVRTEIVKSGKSPYQDPKQVPVAIFQLGPWPGGRDTYDRVTKAQHDFVDNDPRSILIQNPDLSHFYHFDAPSQLIMGYRLANQWIDKFMDPNNNNNNNVMKEEETTTTNAAVTSAKEGERLVAQAHEDAEGGS